MALAPITIQQLIDAGMDAETLEQVVNGAADLGGDGLVDTRLGGQIKTLARLEAEYQTNIDLIEGVADAVGSARLYDTKAEADAALAGIPANGWFEVVNDESQGGALTLYRKVAGVAVLKRVLSADLGMVSAEQLGVPAYDPAGDQMDAMQLAADNAMASGRELILTKRRYRVARTALPGDYDPATDYATTGNTPYGNFFVVSGQLRMRSTHPLGSIIEFVGRNDANVIGPLLTHFAVIDGTPYGDDKLHRGHGFVLFTGNEPAVWEPQAALEDLASFYYENITFDTGIIADKDSDWPASVANPNSWDITNKFISARNDCQHGRVEGRKSKINGFLGEVHYLGGVFDDDHDSSDLVLIDVEISNTNGTAMNPNGCASVTLDRVYIHDCKAMWEGYTGLRPSSISNTYVRDCDSAGVWGGAAAVGRRDDDSQPVVTLSNFVMQSCGIFGPGSFVRGNAHLIDTALQCRGYTVADRLTNIDLDLTIEVDRANMSGVIGLYAYTGGAAERVENVQIRALLTRSDFAVANGFYMNGIVVLGALGNASYGPNCTIRLRGDQLNGVPAFLGGAPAFTDRRVRILDEGMGGFNSNGFQSAALEWDPVTEPDPEVGYFWLEAVFSGGPALTTQHAVNLPVIQWFSDDTIMDGHEVTFEHNDGNNPNATMLIDGKYVIGYLDRITLKAEKLTGIWRVVRRTKPRRATANINIGSTALNAIAGPFSIPLYGARPNIPASVTPPAAGSGGFAVTAIRPGTDEIEFWVTNLDGANPEDPAAADWIAELAA